MALALVDSHVHFYRRFDAWAGIEAAAASFSRTADRMALPSHRVGVLMFVRSAGEAPFHELHGRLASEPADGWTLGPDGQMGWLRATRHSDGMAVYVIEGRQVRASNGLEVLALASGTDFEDGRPFATTLERVLHSGAVTVVPWGFGKWLGPRKRQVEGALARASEGRLFLGDNASRPTPLPEPKLFGAARARGVFVLPGSDPLRVPGQERSIGRFGFLLDGFDPLRPVESLRRSLADLRGQPEIFGERDNVLRSVYMQIRLRLGTGAVGRSAVGARA